MMATIIEKSGVFRRRLRWRATAVGALFLFSGCAPYAERTDLPLRTNDGELRAEQHVLVATTRNRMDQPGVYFGTDRAAKTDYAEVFVSTPPAQTAVAMQITQPPPDDSPGSFTIRSANYLSDEDAFLLKLNAELRRLPQGRRQILLYIHGFNTIFSDAVLRSAQLSYDVKLPNVPVVFSWASRGDIFDYAYDNNSAMVARAALGRFLILLERSDAEKINVVAHSLGNMLFAESLVQLKLRAGPPKKHKIGLIFLASPDIDYDVFKSQLTQLGRPEVPYFILLSKDDQALGLSTAIAGGRPRLGDYANPKELTSLGATVIDATDIAAQDPAHHDKYARIAQIAPQLIQAFGHSSPTHSARWAQSTPAIALGGAMLQIYSGR